MIRRYLRTVPDPFAYHLYGVFFRQFGLSRTAKVLEQLRPRFQSSLPDDPLELGPKVYRHFSISRNDMLLPCLGKLEGFYHQGIQLRDPLPDFFYHELTNLIASVTETNDEFFEIYDSNTGAIHGGFQPVGPNGMCFESCRHQTWSATAFLRMVFRILLGMRFKAGDIDFKPILPTQIKRVELTGMPWRDSHLHVIVQDGGKTVQRINNGYCDEKYGECSGSSLE